jgi:predicted GNAT family N-acyltransferase
VCQLIHPGFSHYDKHGRLLLVSIADWSIHEDIIYSIREQVFVQEQGVPIELERDDQDNSCAHAIARVADSNLTIATGRVLSDGHIGRIAVLEPFRESGVGSVVLSMLIRIAAANKLTSVYLNSQLAVISFYERHGFQVVGKEFLDAGIMHRRMTMRISDYLPRN